MRVPARALKPLVVLAVAAASVGCISPAAYAEDTSVSVTSDSSNHVVVDVDLSACASDSGSDRQGAEKDGQGESVSETEAELAQIKAAEEVAIRQNQLDLKQADLKKQADKAKAEADRYAAEQAAEADLYKRTKQAEAARIECQNQSDAELYSAQKDAEGIQARAKAEAEATRLKGESEGAAEKAHGEGVAAGIKAQAEAYNGMDNPYLLANRYIDIMPKVAEQVAKPLTAVDSIKMYGSGNAQKLVKETTSIVDQVASGLKDSTGIDLPSLLNGLLSNPDIDADSAENSVE